MLSIFGTNLGFNVILSCYLCYFMFYLNIFFFHEGMALSQLYMAISLINYWGDTFIDGNRFRIEAYQSLFFHISQELEVSHIN